MDRRGVVNLGLGENIICGRKRRVDKNEREREKRRRENFDRHIWKFDFQKRN